jgi:hypothetical protein
MQHVLLYSMGGQLILLVAIIMLIVRMVVVFAYTLTLLSSFTLSENGMVFQKS